MLIVINIYLLRKESEIERDNESEMRVSEGNLLFSDIHWVGFDLKKWTHVEDRVSP